MTNDPFAGTTPAVSFKDAPVGTIYHFTVREPAELVQEIDYDTDRPATWEDGNPRLAAVLPVTVDGEDRAIWARRTRKEGSLFRALAEAQREAGSKFEPGGKGWVKFAGEEPAINKKFSPRKLYAAGYTPPTVAPSAAGDEPPW